MNNDNKDEVVSSAGQDITTKIAAIEAESDQLAQQNQTPDEVADVQPVTESVQDSQSLSIAPKKSKINYKKWSIIGAAVAILLLLMIWFVPTSRFVVLNLVGLRGSLQISGRQEVSQAQAKQVSIKNFSVEVDGHTYASGNSASFTIGKQKFGRHSVTVKKTGYAPFTQQVTVDFNPFFGLFSGGKRSVKVAAQLKPQGIPLTFSVKDWASQLPLASGEFSLGDLTAAPSKDGKVTLNVSPDAGDKVTIKANFTRDYLSKTFELEVNKKGQEISFVPSARHYFVSKRSGVFSIYSSYLDGSDIKELVKGTNQETQSLQFAVSPSGKYGVMASTRDGRRDENGNLLQKLYWIDLSTGRFEEQEKANYIILRDWSGDFITYNYSYYEGGQYKQRLRSLDVTTRNQYELGSTSGTFNRVHVAGSAVIFTKQEAYGMAGFEKGQSVYTVGIKGEGQRELATNIEDFRQLFFERFTYQATDKKWYEVNTNTNQVKPIETPGQEDSLYIATESSKKERVFINFVDGQRILMLQGSPNKQLATQAGMTGPIRFLNSTTVVYRVVTPVETADYAVSTLGGQPRKVTDVTASSYATPVFFSYY